MADDLDQWRTVSVGDPVIRVRRPEPPPAAGTCARFNLPVTPATLRARIATRLELLRGEDPDSHRYMVGLQRVAELERDLAALEARGTGVLRR